MEKSPKPVASIPPFGLRMQPALKSSLEESAKANARSLNAEIVSRLEESLQGKEVTGPDGKRILSAIQRLEGLLASTEAQLSIANQRMLILANAMATAYPVVASAIKSSPQLREAIERPVNAGMRTVKHFVETYEPKGYEAMENFTSTARRMFPGSVHEIPSLGDFIDASKKAKGVEERTIQKIKAIIDEFQIPDIPKK